MSLINQVLKDLDQQRGPADGLQVAALKGIGLVQAKQTQWPAILTASAFGLTLAVTGFILFQFAGQWAEGEVENEPAPVVDTEPVTAITATPETLKTIAEAVVATPAPPLPVEPPRR